MAHSQQLVSYARQGHVATNTLNRPDKRNAFNADLVRSLRQALADFDGDREARVAILCGAGKAFSSGADVQERQMRTPEAFARLGGPQEPDAHTGDLFVRSVNWKPVIAAVHGAVMGLGVRSCRSRPQYALSDHRNTAWPRRCAVLEPAPHLRRRRLRHGGCADRKVFQRR
jgi:enoyl-CoA hydratase/carnithine racemase